MLLEEPGQLKTRSELIERVWPTTVVEEHNLTWYVSALRRLLGDEGETAQYIETVRGQGYRFIATVIKQPAGERQPPPAAARRWPLRLTAIVAIVAIGASALTWWLMERHHPPRVSRAIPAVAVLPFENLSADKNNVYFASGIQDTILTKLAGVSGLRVISRTSTEQYASHPQNLKSVARQLGVSAVLEGSVQRVGDKVLINVQLIDAATDNHLWAQTYTRTLDNVFEVESDVARQVAAGLKARLRPSEAAQIAAVPTDNPHAYELFLKAEYLAIQAEEGTVADPAAAAIEAAGFYRQAIELDEDFALAHARLSYLESYVYWFYLDHKPAHIAAATQAAQRAVKLDPKLPQAHLAMGYVHYWCDRNYAAALREFELAAKGLPSNAGVIAAAAYIHRRQGDWQKALIGLNQASVLDPRNPLYAEELANTLASLRRYTDALQAYDRALAIKPLGYSAMVRKIGTLLMAGKLDQATQVLKEIPGGDGQNGFVASVTFEAERLAHQPQAALAALENAPAWLEVPRLPGLVPTPLLRGWALEQLGRGTDAHNAYEKARAMLRDRLRMHPDDATLWSLLGTAEGALGETAAAIRDSRKAVAMLPVSADAVDGPSYPTALAELYAQLGQPAEAVELLRKLLAIPAGGVISLPLLKLDPVWDPIRASGQFKSLMNNLEASQASLSSRQAA